MSYQHSFLIILYVCHRAVILALVNKASFVFTALTKYKSYICLLEDYVSAQTTAHTFRCIGSFQMIVTLYYLDNGVNYSTNTQISHVLEPNRILRQLNEMQFASQCYTVISYQALFRLSVRNIVLLFFCVFLLCFFCMMRDFSSPT